jgi:hypothetical protein
LNNRRTNAGNGKRGSAIGTQPDDSTSACAGQRHLGCATRYKTRQRTTYHNRSIGSNPDGVCRIGTSTAKVGCGGNIQIIRIREAQNQWKVNLKCWGCGDLGGSGDVVEEQEQHGKQDGVSVAH